MKQLLATAILLIGAACGAPDGAGSEGATTTSPDQVPPTTSTSTPAIITAPVIAGDFPVGAYGAGWSDVGAFPGYLEFREDGTGSLRALDAHGVVDQVFTYAVEGDQVELSTAAECEALTATHTWSFDDDVLRIGLSAFDPCVLGSPADDWYPLGDAPVIETRVSERPVTIDTDVGRITWQVVDGQQYASSPVTFGQGFAAVIADDDGTRLMTSDDGVVWNPIPQPPSTPEVLAARGDELFVVARRAPTAFYRTDDGGMTWSRLEVDGALAGEVSAFHAGPTGVVLVERTDRPARELSMPPATGALDDGTLRITVADVTDHAGDDLAVVLYEGGDLTDLDRDAIGGFWSVVTSEDFTVSEIVRSPAEPGAGPFPYVADAALTLDPGVYTLVLWLDPGLGPASRWVPVDTDGKGLVGCQLELEVAATERTDVRVVPRLHADGWNTDCVTGEVIPVTDPTEPLLPSHTPWEAGPADFVPPETSTWVLGTDSFELVADAPSPIADLFVLDSGFVATPFFVDVEPRFFWSSVDGRSWETIDSQRDLYVLSSSGDELYGAPTVNEGITSTDGGRTWTEPRPRPGGPGDWLTVGELGYFAVETALFGPLVGVVWASPDDVTWERVLNPWPPPLMDPPVIAGRTILIPSEHCLDEGHGREDCRRLDWIGVIG